MAAALVFLILVLWFSVYALLTEQREEEISIGFQYEQQLLISEGLGLEQAAVCYEMAAELCPERFDWCIHLMERICADYLFSLEEERVLKKLIYTVPEGQQTMYAELLPGDPEIFGTFSYEVGIAYWYFYEASGGKRAAAAWFAHAVNSQQYKADWYEAAVVYEKISSYYEKIDRKNERGEQELGYGIYWNDLLNLWKLDYFETEMKVIQKQVAEELLAGILLRCGELQAEQITYEQVQGVLGELQQFGMELGEEENAKTEFLEQCQMAEMAAGRVYGE